MFEIETKYWYKDSFIQIPDGMQHHEYAMKYFTKMFPKKNAKTLGLINPADFEGHHGGYCLNHGYARLSVGKCGAFNAWLYIEYLSSFKNSKKLYSDILKNLNNKIIRVTYHIGHEQKDLTIEEFLELNRLP